MSFLACTGRAAEPRSDAHAALPAEADQDAHHEQEQPAVLSLVIRDRQAWPFVYRAGKAELNAAVMSPAMQWQRAHWWQLLEPLNQQRLVFVPDECIERCVAR